MTGIKLDGNNNFETRRGDFFIDDTDLQDETNILYANKGNFLASPTLGVGIETFSNSPMSKPALERIIRKEFEKDSIEVTKITVTTSSRENDSFDVQLITNRREV